MYINPLAVLIAAFASIATLSCRTLPADKSGLKDNFRIQDKDDDLSVWILEDDLEDLDLKLMFEEGVETINTSNVLEIAGAIRDRKKMIDTLVREKKLDGLELTHSDLSFRPDARPKVVRISSTENYRDANERKIPLASAVNRLLLAAKYEFNVEKSFVTHVAGDTYRQILGNWQAVEKRLGVNIDYYSPGENLQSSIYLEEVKGKLQPTKLTIDVSDLDLVQLVFTEDFDLAREVQLARNGNSKFILQQAAAVNK